MSGISHIFYHQMHGAGGADVFNFSIQFSSDQTAAAYIPVVLVVGVLYTLHVVCKQLNTKK